MLPKWKIVGPVLELGTCEMLAGGIFMGGPEMIQRHIESS